MRPWQNLPEFMKVEAVRPYHDYLRKCRIQLAIKAVADRFFALLLLIILLPLFLVLAIMIKADSKGPVFYVQNRVTQYGRVFRIYKFRTMVEDADKIGYLITADKDPRVTKIGIFLRRVRLDEIPQLINILWGDMSFVGTRPEVQRYVDCYTQEMYATLLLPAGVTSEATLLYKDEAQLLEVAEDSDQVYINEVLPQKMAFNLNSLRHFSLWNEFKTVLKTVVAVLR